MAISSLFKTLGTVLLKVVAFWILLVAAYLALGRQFFPYVDRYEDELASVLGDQLGAEVSIGRLSGRWQQFNPVLIAENVQIGATTRITRVVLEPSVIQSLATLSPVFNRFELDGFVANLEQGSDGWLLAGMSASGGQDQVPLERLTTLLRQQREVIFKQVTLHVQPSQLPSMAVVMDDGRLTGAGEDNWLRANARVLYRDLEVPIELQLESTMVVDQYAVDVYVRHGRLDFSPWLTSRWPQIAEFNLSGEYWASLRRDTWQNLTARVFSRQARLEGGDAELRLNDIETELYAERAAKGIDLWINHLGHKLSAADQPQLTSEPVRARVSQRGSQWQMQWDRLPLAPVSAWLSLNDGSGFWRNAFPTGELGQGKLRFNMGDWQSLRLTSELRAVLIRPYAGIPGVSGVGGSIRVEGPAARLSFDNERVSLELPHLYEQGQEFSRMQGVVDARWWPGIGVQLEGRHEASATPSSLQQDRGDTDLAVKGHWRVDLPISNKDTADRDVNFRLALEAPRASTSWAKRLTPTGPLDDTVNEWIDDNILAGDFHQVHFVYSSAFKEGRVTEQNLGVDALFSGARVRFHEDWPALEGGAGSLRVGSESLEVRPTAGRLAGLELDSGHLTLPYQSNRVDMDASITAPAEAVLALFQDGPLASVGDATVDDWRVAGLSTGRLSLSVPLDGAPPRVSVVGQVQDGKLGLPSYDLVIDEINGDINYNTEQGVHARRLMGNLFGEPHQASLRNPQDEGATVFELDVQGETPLAAWGHWLGDPWLGAQTFKTPAQAQLRFASGETDIRVQSSLFNVPLDFPASLAKQAEEPKELNLHLHFDDEDRLVIRGNYADQLNAYFDVDKNQDLQGGTLAFGRPLEIRDEAGVFFDVEVSKVDMDAWWTTIQAIAEYYPTSQEQALNEPADTVAYGADWIREINLRGDNWTYLGMPWTQPRVQLQRNKEAWLARFEARETQGRVLIPHAEAPLFVDMSFLALGDRQEPEQAIEEVRSVGEESTGSDPRQDPLVDLRPLDVPSMDIQIAQLSVGDRDLGNWRAEIESDESGLNARNIQAEMPGTRLTGSLSWAFADNRHQSGFEGQVRTGNINNMLREWGYVPVLVSSNGDFDLDLDWRGSPAFFDFRELKGRIGLRLNKGSILELEEYEGVKLIGLLNFTRVLRRLALDFSDLIQDGITYDLIEGELLFDRGFARVGEKLIIDGPAMKFRFTGDADLLRDELDVDMVMTVPLSSTFPLVALLAGVSPQAAAAIYVTERVFNNELERLSSARIHVTGSLNEPKLRFYRVFDNSGGRQGPSVGDRLKNVVPGGTGN